MDWYGDDVPGADAAGGVVQRQVCIEDADLYEGDEEATKATKEAHGVGCQTVLSLANTRVMATQVQEVGVSATAQMVDVGVQTVMVPEEAGGAEALGTGSLEDLAFVNVAFERAAMRNVFKEGSMQTAAMELEEAGDMNDPFTMKRAAVLSPLDKKESGFWRRRADAQRDLDAKLARWLPDTQGNADQIAKCLDDFLHKWGKHPSRL
jgi:hypothetical protein